MASLILIAVCIGLVLYRIYKFMFYRPPNFPPGPPRLPYFGSYLYLLLLNYKHMHFAVDALCRFYKSNIIGFYFGPVPTIVVNDAAGVKEALYNRNFDGRPDLLLARLRDPERNLRGVFFTQGDLWHTQRRFTLRYLRDYGFGRRFTELELEIRDEIQIFIDMLKNGPEYPHEEELVQNGNIFCPLVFFGCFTNCFLKTLTNERLPRHELHKIFTAGRYGLQFQRYGDDFGRMFSLLPWIADVFPDLSDYNKVKGGNDGIYAFMKEIVDEHIQTYDENHERSFLDLYIKEMKAAEQNNETQSTFCYKQLIVTCMDFLFPSLTGLGVTVSLLIQRLKNEPDVITKMQHEIDEVVGRGRLPELDDRVYMPYTEATIREGMRLETLVPSGLPHASNGATTIMGYDIPKGSFVVTGLRSSHIDKNRWNDAEKFMPERFLDYTGKLSTKKDYSLPFGAGKRLCAGETFARNMLFLMVSSLYQNFDMKESQGQKIPALSENLTGLIITPPDYWVKCVAR